MSIFHNSRQCYCAFCRSPRKIYLQRHLGLFQIFMSLVVTLLMMAVVWGEFEPRAFILFVAFLAVGEAFSQFRWRMYLVCRKCGFDPVLYLRDKTACVAKVKAHLEQRKAQPESFFWEPLQIPSLSKKRAEMLQQIQENQRQDILQKETKKPHLLSKQV